jgi:hypothetical protein
MKIRREEETRAGAELIVVLGARRIDSHCRFIFAGGRGLVSRSQHHLHLRESV